MWKNQILFTDFSKVEEFQGEKIIFLPQIILNTSVMPFAAKNQMNPQKLLLSKWTALEPRDKEKHFLVTKVIDPEKPKHLIELVVMEALMSKRNFTMRWEELTDATKWVQPFKLDLAGESPATMPFYPLKADSNQRTAWESYSFHKQVKSILDSP